ncbi:translocated intimin receptor Tir [Granulicella sp. S190]|nr:translocated intimin receptor Tir [Granulicella sp. S190]
MSLAKDIKTVVTDSHFLVPLGVLVLGIALLVILH